MSSSSASSSSSRPSCVANESTLPWQTLADRQEMYGGPLRDAASAAHVYRYKKRSLNQATGGKDLACALYEVEAGGSTAFPYHAHSIYEEAVYILSGEGLMRMPDGDFTVTAGDYIALLPGESRAHQLWNFTSDTTLRYLCMSTNGPNDAVVYPDSGKVLVKGASITPGIFVRDTAVNYLHGEGKVYKPKA